MLVRVVVVMLTMCSVAVMVAVASSRSIASPSDPFAPYSDLFSWEGVWLAFSERKFTCQDLRYDTVSMCSYTPENKYFSTIYIDMIGNFPAGISFDVNSLALRVGDLVMLWGMPEVLPLRSGVNLYWEERQATAGIPTITGNNIDYHAPVYSVSFTFN